MIESISMNNSSTLNVSTSTANAVQKSAQQKNAQAVVAPPTIGGTSTIDQTVSESSQGDILELSKKGVTQSKSAVQQAAASVVSGDSSETQNLSQYTAAELTKMVTAGTITQAEMNTELADRTKKAAEQTIVNEQTGENEQTNADGQASENTQISAVKE
ncbi:hypothetical protein [[Clostridium] fimetarium]|uniref:Uncharacterized protein n=1 Tax=[Clostridium] fimetarium TaxID=99656 RepID=A0A1I0R2I5_9FIRM|nr:hypothetical protein [[Clostridium] fimetarium]SEW34583.1 hypothetical protein SAMN05421659_11186 [[Clostridium] fimetarium]